MIGILRKYRKIINISIVFFWIIFYYVWGFLGWSDAHIFEESWWFDTAGHALFGFAGAITLLYLYRTYSLHGLFYFAGHKHLAVIVVAHIVLLGTLWELIELLWDLYIQPEYMAWLAKAQGSSMDTTIDILAETIAAFVVMFLYVAYNKAYEKFYPDNFRTEKKELLEEVAQHLSIEIARHKKEHRKEFYLSILRALRKHRKKNSK